jgi:serine/threonine-protein kinase
MVMEFVRGETLEHMVGRLGPLSPQRAADLCMQGLAALSHAHRMGVVHRDLKPANIMITESGAVKIMDFGIARVAGSEHLTSAGFLMGTPAYMAPEQVTGDEIDARTDLYAFGVVFYYLVTAKLPFKGETPIAMAQSRVVSQHTPIALVRDGLPAWIEPLIDRALSKNPADRFQSADQFREALRRGLAGLPMETISGAVIPPELVATTPPGLVPLPSTSTSGAVPAASSSGANPSVSSGAQPSPSVRVPATPSVKTPAPSAKVPAPPATSQTAAKASATAPVPAPPNTGEAANPAAAAKPAAAKTTSAPQSVTPIALGVAALVLVVLIGWMWARSRSPQPTPAPATRSTDAATTVTPTPSTEVPAPPAPIDTPAASPTTSPAATIPPPVTSPPATTPATTPAAPRAGPPATSGAGATSSPSPSVSSSLPSSSPSPSATSAVTPPPGARGATPTPPARGVAPTTDTELATFGDVKYLKVHGKDADDDDAILQFVGGQVLVTSKKGGPADAMVPYRRVAHATYVHAKMPKWDPGLPAPADGFDVPGIGLFRPARHWLVLQTRTDFTILRLDDSNWKQIIDTFEARTGLKVDQPPAGDE